MVMVPKRLRHEENYSNGTSCACKVVKNLMEGEERVIHARLHRTEDFDASMELGRYRVIDLDELFKHGEDKRAFRLIDTRTITELIVDNELYYV
jgi:hypothetical protein